MKGYLSIGAVSKRKGVSIKSLRYYDRIGVLRPAYINKDTNYRYYKEEQLYLLDAISLCIELGIPLRDFEKYRDAHGNFNLQELLYDGKLLAEQKIMDIRRRLSSVQTALQMLDGKSVPASAAQESGAKPAPVRVSAPAASKAPSPSLEELLKREGFTRRKIPQRAILTAPLAEEDNGNYGQKILRLFMLAQLLGMTASYPSGIVREYDPDGGIQTYIFVQVENYTDCTDKRLHFLPSGNYLCRQSPEHQIDKAEEYRTLFGLSGKPFLVAESDLIDDHERSDDNRFELQLLQEPQ